MTEYYINITKEEIEGYDAITVSITDEDDIIIVSSTEFQRLRDILNSMNDDIDNMILDNIQQVVDNLTTGEYVLNYSTNSTNLIDGDETLTFEMVKDAVNLFDMLKEINQNFELVSIGREARISLTATKPYLLSNETTDVVVKLKDDLGEPLTNKKVAIEQSVFIDNGTTATHNDNWVKYNPDNITITRGEEYTSVSGSNYRYGVPISKNCKIKVEARKTTQSTGTLLSIWGYSSNPLSASQLLLFSVDEMGMTQGTFANIEMTVTPTTVTVKNLDNGTTITKEYNTTHNLIFNFWGTIFDYKNFKVYETIKGVTDENGEFALHDVSVSDDTTFTATYSNISATCTVYGGVVFYDNATSQSKNTHWKIRTSDQSDLTATVNTVGTTLTNASTSASRFYFANPNDSTSESPPITISDFVVEADILNSSFIDSDSQIAFLLQGQTNALNLKGYTVPYHIKIEKKGTNVNHYVDDTLIRTTTISDRTNYYMGFQLFKRASITFRNYVIREI